jgi:TolB-like protein
VDALQRELGAEPSPETRALFASIRDANHQAESKQSSPHVAIPEKDADNPRVAVLPFGNLSNEKDNYFADGITEDIITALSRFHSLDVIARGSTFVYKNKDATVQEQGCDRQRDRRST